MSRSKKRRKRQKENRRKKKPPIAALNILANPDDHKETNGDLVLVKKALRYGTLTADRIDQVVDRVVGIALKTEVQVVGKDGEVHSADGPADINSLKAADIVKGMVAQIQKDEHFEKRQLNPKQPGTSPQINIGVNVGTDETRDRLAAVAARIGIDYVPEGGDAKAADVDSEAAVRVLSRAETESSGKE